MRQTRSLCADQKTTEHTTVTHGIRCFVGADERALGDCTQQNRSAAAAAASTSFTMRCTVCGCDKGPAGFSGAQKKRPAVKRKCAACTAAGANGSDAHVHAGAPTPSLAHQVVKKAPIEAMFNTITPTTSPADRAAAAVDTTALNGGKGGTMACSACGKQLAGTTASHQHWQKCSRCKQALCCDAGCQREHWKRGGHKQACKAPMGCSICLDNDGPPLPIQGGCGCREEAGCAHVACRVQAAEHQGLGFHEGWHTCTTCKQHYTGAMRLGLAEPLWERHRRKPWRNHDRQDAQNLLANATSAQGRHQEAAELYRELVAVFQRRLGADHYSTLSAAMNLGMTLRNQGKHSEAEAVIRDSLPRMQRVLGPQHECTLRTSGELAAVLQTQQRYDEAEPMLRDTLAMQRRVNGPEPPRHPRDVQ